MRMSAALLCAGLAASMIFAALSSPARADSGDAAAIMRLVAASEVRIHQTVPARRACVRAATFATALDSARDQRRNLTRLIDSGRPEPVLRDRRDALGAPNYRWLRPSAPPSAAWTDNRPLPPAEARGLSDAAGAIIRGDAQSRIVERVDAAWLPDYVFCAADRAVPALAFSAPAIRGDIAFVETGFTCGGLCGNGLLYALRRDAHGWTIVAVVATWIS
jgi:hypothetical protein